MKTVAVLGAGRVGGLIASDLASDPDLRVRVADADRAAVERLARDAEVEPRVADLSDPAEVARTVEGADAVVGAVPGRLGITVLRTAIECGKPVADIAFSAADPWTSLNGLALERGVPAVVDCGVAPGLSNLFVGRSAADLDTVDRVRILVGGLPVRRVLPWEYRSVFSPTDVIEEYTRPARIRRGGREVVLPALSEVETVDLPEVGTVEAFLTDGLRSLLRTVDAPDLVEKTLRWPGHAERIRVLRDSGFLDDDPVDVAGIPVSPRAVSEALLFRSWEREDDDVEFTVLRVEVEGRSGGRPVRDVWDLLDRTDPDTGATSMARTTGFPCALALRLLLRGDWNRPGVHPPEVLGADRAVTETILEGLAERGVRVARAARSPDPAA